MHDPWKCSENLVLQTTFESKVGCSQFNDLTKLVLTHKPGVPSHFSYTVRISTGLNEPESITSWNLDSVDAYRERIAKQNDGTLPLEPYQRLSQSVFEAWLRSVCDRNPLIELRFGWKAESVEETGVGSTVVATNVKTHKRQTIFSRFIGACDGASSRIRRGLSIPLDGGPV
jgi:FAD-dependent monooxygenase